MKSMKSVGRQWILFVVACITSLVLWVLLHGIVYCTAVTARLFRVTYHSVCAVITARLMTCYHSVFQPFQWSGTHCSNFDCSLYPWRTPEAEGPKFEAEDQRVGKWFLGRGSEPPPHQLGGLGERCKLPLWGSGTSPDRKYILDHSKSLENTSSGRKCQMQLNFFTEHRWSRGTLGYDWRNLRFRGTLVEKHYAIMSFVLSYHQCLCFCQLCKCSVYCGQFFIWMPCGAW